jgi:short-subunit dehydrogenase
MRLKPLDEQVIVIMGASSGIGLATARLAADAGARVVLAARSTNALEQLVNEIRLHGGEAVAVPADVSVEADVHRVADEAARIFGGFDTWINNAAVSAYGSCTEVSLPDMRRIMETNFWGTVYGSRIACEHLRNKGGALINLGSVLSDRSVPLQGIYSATKQAIKAWTDALRVELAHDRVPISVSLIKPAAINTPYAEHARNYLPDQPTHTFPVYTTRSVARAILHAAAHPVREVVVGSGGKVLRVASAIAPSFVDSLTNRFLMRGFHSGRPSHGRPALYEATEDLREDGEYRGLVRPSLYTALRIRPKTTGLLVLGAAALLMAVRKAGT